MEYLRTLSFIAVVLAGTLVFSNAAFAQTETISPLKQIKSGILPQDIKCKQGLVLIIKVTNDFPACVKPPSVTRLLVQGWITLDKFETIHQITNHNETASTISHENTTLLLNGTSNATGLGSSTINASMIYKWYKDWQAGNQDPYHEVSGAIPMSPLQVTPTISSTNKNSIKILLIGMSPNQLKVGDKPEFTITYQNISDKPIYTYSGCTATLLGVVMSPSDNVIVDISSGERGLKCPNHGVLINPNQINTDVAGPDPTNGHIGTSMYSSFSPGFYQITKPGTLHVTMELFLQNQQEDRNDLMETVQFDVNATQ